MHFGDDRGERVVVWMLRLGTISAVFLGSMAGSGVAWTIGDIGVGVMAWINIVAILLLSPKALRSLRDYERQKKQGLEPNFDPEALDIKHCEYWHSLAE
jgi:AGCS family alanine or glycine:cation symporter